MKKRTSIFIDIYPLFIIIIDETSITNIVVPVAYLYYFFKNLIDYCAVYVNIEKYKMYKKNRITPNVYNILTKEPTWCSVNRLKNASF